MNFSSLTKLLKGYQSAYSPWMERILICLAVLIVYASVWPNDFLFDDGMLIYANAFLAHWNSILKLLTSQNFVGGGGQGMFYRPVPMLLHFFVYQLFGASTIAFHALNIALQALNACLLHHFGIRAGFRKGASFAAALLWAVHPLHTEAVTYMSATPELLWSTFCLLGLIALLPDFTPRKMWWATIYFILALGSKESAVVFPALAAATYFFVARDRTQVSAYLKMWPLWRLAAGYILIWMVFIYKTGYWMPSVSHLALSEAYSQDYTNNFINRFFTALATLPVYAGLIVWPDHLYLNRNFPVFTTLRDWLPATGALMAALGLLQILWGGARRGLALSFGILWFVISLSPATGISFPVDAPILEHWMYFPTMGIFLGLSQTVAEFLKKKKSALQLLVFIMVVSLGIRTFIQNEKWRDTETLYQNIVQNNGDTSALEFSLGLFYLDRYEFDKAAEQFRRMIDKDQAIPGNLARDHFKLAMALIQISKIKIGILGYKEVIAALRSSPHIPEAIEELNKALQADPNYYWAHVILRTIYIYQGNAQMAELHKKKIEDILRKYGLM